jgi:hypothetical protein
MWFPSPKQFLAILHRKHARFKAVFGRSPTTQAPGGWHGQLVAGATHNLAHGPIIECHGRKCRLVVARIAQAKLPHVRVSGAFTIAKPEKYCFNVISKMPRSPDLPTIASPSEL